jgi:hypothetical protein
MSLTAGAGFLLIRLVSPTPSPHASPTRAVTPAVQPTAGTPESIIVATWITAIATAVLALFAIVTAVFAFFAFRGQLHETRLLQKQVEDQQDERAREAAERRRAQAAQVFITTGGLTPDTSDEIVIRNTSEQPIYDLAALRTDDAELQRLPFLMPGDEYPFFAAIQNAAGTMPLVWLDFRDAAGLHWRTTSRGELTERPS